MAPKPNPIKSKEHQARKPVVQKAIADTSGSSLADFKNKAIDIAKVAGSRAAVGPIQFLLNDKQVKSVAAETSGINDVKRFKENPSPLNAAMVALSAAQYVAPLVKPIYNARAITAANNARALPVAEADLTKIVRLGKNSSGIREGVLRGAGEVRSSVAPATTGQINLMGRDLTATSFNVFETTKNPANIISSRASNAARTMIQRGKQVESNLNIIAGLKSTIGTSRAMEPKNKKK